MRQTLHRVSCASTLHLLLAVALSSAACAQNLSAPRTPPVALDHSTTVQDYRTHIRQLESLTAACARSRSRSSCEPAAIGPDDMLPVAGQSRLVSYEWLRILFSRAQEPDTVAPVRASGSVLSPDLHNPSDILTTTRLLENAQARLAADFGQANRAVAIPPAHTQERATLRTVLAGREFRKIEEANDKPSLLERMNNWLNDLFAWLGTKQARAAWIGRLLIWGLLLAITAGLVWALLQSERRWRLRLVPDTDLPAPGAASARDWQLWLADARQAVASAAWREAIHFLYWAAISRLESKRLWPADRARTPREYLALVAPEDSRKSQLGALTREFEWAWYGGRPAGELDYHRAESAAMALVEGSTERHGGNAI